MKTERRRRRSPGEPPSPCSEDECDRLARCKGLCHGHYERQRKGHQAQGPLAPRVKGGVPCSVPGCDRIANMRGLCTGHGRRLEKRGDLVADTPIGGLRAGVHITSQGYRQMLRPDHLNASKGGYIFEHRLVMTEHLGRPLAEGETVHHLNGNRLDNRLANLELWVTSPVRGVRVEDLVASAVETLQRYAPERLAS